MGRRKKEELRADGIYLPGNMVYIGDTYTCPVCNKEFKLTKEHSAIVHNEYTCSWKCFLDYVKEHPIVSKAERKKKEKDEIAE